MRYRRSRLLLAVLVLFASGGGAVHAAELTTRQFAAVLDRADATQEVAPESPLRTPAERSGFTETATYDEVNRFLRALAERSDRVRLDSIGTTHEGREIPLAILADPPVDDAARARRDDRLVVLLFGNIHAGEVCGKDALLMLARELATSEDRGVLEDLIVCVVPIYNADGNERFSPDNRPGQVGPNEMGTRENAQGLDLNRDYVKLEAPETRALVRFMNRWDPAVIVDTHTTNGSRHRFTLTYQGPKHPATDDRVLTYVRDTMLPAIDGAVEEATGYETFFYGNFADDHSKWVTYPAEPRYGVAYRGMRNRLSIITEAYAYAPFEDRVRATLAFCAHTLEYAAEHAGEIAELINAADERTIEAGRDPDGSSMVPVRTDVEAFDEKVTIPGYAPGEPEQAGAEAGEAPHHGEGAPPPPGEPMDHEVQFVNRFVAELSVPRPWAYVFGPELQHVARNLQRHGVEVEVLREHILADVETYTVTSFQRAQEPYEGHRLVTSVGVSKAPGTRRLEPGIYVVRTAQKLGTLASYLLEPQASDGLVAWNFFHDHMAEGEAFPVIRLPTRQPMTTRDAPPLPEDRERGTRITYELLFGEEAERPNLSGDPVRIRRWLDDEHFLQRKGGQWRRVHAVSGRSEPIETDTEAIAERLAGLATIEPDDAERIARRHFARPGEDRAMIVFTHHEDLYAARADGSSPRRLTATPGREQMPTLSDDGAFVSFVRDSDLWVVDTQTGTERALTTGGSDLVRHARASWVYYEEIFRRSWKAHWWSPDSRHIAYLTTDSTPVPEFTIVGDHTEPQTIETTRYPKPGDPNPRVSLRIAHAAGAEPRRVDLSGYDPGAFLISWVGWSDDGATLRFAVQDRAQTWLDLLEVGTRGGKPTRLMRETTEAWVTPQGAPRELEDGSLILASERDGFRHLYRFESLDAEPTPITRGQYEVRRVHHVDEDAGWIYFTGTVDTSLAEHLYRVRLDPGAEEPAEPERLTPQRGHHRVRMNDAGTLFVDRWSSIEHPARVALRSSDGSLVRMIDTNPVYELKEYDLGRVEMTPVESDKGVRLEAMTIYPPDFDPAGTYPVWFKTYAGPHAPTVRDTWSGARLNDQMLASEGIVVFRGDPYPASGKGARSAWTAYRQLGVRELEDIAELIAWIKNHEWVDPGRIGMSGHSYGGFMTAYAMTHSELFAAGIAGAPVTSWLDYDSIYTERYMHTPQNNPEGYEQTSVVAAADDLHGRLLLLHGTMDDNVHMQNSTKLIRALQRANKDFDVFIYPGFRHGLFSEHYRDLVHGFIIETMRPAGAGEPGQDPASEPDRTPRPDDSHRQPPPESAEHEAVGEAGAARGG